MGHLFFLNRDRVRKRDLELDLTKRVRMFESEREIC
jgi:hypothetical protein